MKILFLCGSIEKSKDGIGDYCRKLSIELNDIGIFCSIIALNDVFVSETLQESENKINIFRISSKLDKYTKLSICRSYIQAFKPDIISIQFVAYNFNSKGVLYNKINFFREITKGFPVHIMFHELWLGAHVGADWKEKIVGAFQKHYILKLIYKLNPIIIHTNTHVFNFLLNRNNIKNKTLPIFSNIAKNIPPSSDWIYHKLKESDINIVPDTKDQFLIFIFFGSLNPDWNPSRVMKKVLEISQKHSKKILILRAGESKFGEGIWNKISSKTQLNFFFYNFGKLEESKISDLLSFADFGLTTYPDILIEKSGTIAAMQEHKLPVIISNFTLKIKNYNDKDLSYKSTISIDNLEEELYLTNKQRNEKAGYSVKDIAKRFISDLNE